jgi:hypothetical protein
MRGWAVLSLAVLAMAAPARAEEPLATPATPTPTPTAAASAAEPPPPPAPYNRVAVQAEGAFGISGTFYNVLFGGRFDRCFTMHTCMGGYLAYANLKGQSGRANNVLVYAMVEHRRPLGEMWHIPLRIAVGYLPNNGPFMRFSGGLSIALGNVDLTFDLIAPTVWVTRNDPVVSMDASAEAALRF